MSAGQLRDGEWEAIGRGEHDGQILRQAQRFVGPEDVARAEAGDPAQRDAGGHPATAVEIEQRVGEEAAAGPLALGEIGGEFEGLGHTNPASQIPSAAAARPQTTLTTMLATAGAN